MHIKKLEISGFKSFIDRTVIHFDHDIIGIVGPNGCGKSNIVDAIRWCMGEQSAKHLRGRSMEDVIFNGSDSRPPHGMAEVTLTFDNTDVEYAAALPVEFRDFPELAITRRLYRDGTSEYLINRTQVRLRDVTELFLGTGVGTKAYSIVEQGRIGQIVTARPEDRRLYIEEAAGITKYKQRRRIAERKMELTRQNLLRLNDIVAEIERSRSSLKRQVAKAERYLQYRSELEDLALHEASHKLLELTVIDRVERQLLEQSRHGAELLKQRVRSLEDALEGSRHDAAETEQRSEETARRSFEIDQEVSNLGAEIARSRDALAHLTQRLETAKSEREGVLEQSRRIELEQADLLARIEELSSDETARAEDAAAEDVSLERLRSEEGVAAGEVERLREQATGVGTEHAKMEARLDGLAHRLDEGRSRRQRLENERESLQGERATLAARQGALERSAAEALEGRRLTEAERAELEREMESLRGQQLDSERAVDAAKNQLGLTRSRLQALDDLHRRLEGVGAGTRALLSSADPRVLGMVADRIEAPEELTAAFAGLLGERLQYVVVRDAAAGVDLLAELREAGRGRGHVIPARPRYVAGRTFSPPSAPAEEPNVFGRLADRLEYAAEDAPLVEALIGDAVLVESAAAALDWAARHAGTTAVALDGTVVYGDGAISGGGRDDAAAGMVEQKRELHHLATELARLETEYAARLEGHNALRARVAQVQTSLERARQGAHEGELLHVTTEKDLVRVVSELERIDHRLVALERELAEVSTLLEQAGAEQTECRKGLDELRLKREQLHHALAKADANATNWREQVAAQASLVTERKVRLAQVREQADAARAASERTSAQLVDLGERARRLDAEETEAARASGETAARMLLARERRTEAVVLSQQAHERLETARAALDRARQALGAQEAEVRSLRDELEQGDAEVRKHEMAVQRIELELSHLLESVRERFRGLDLRRVVGDYHARPAPDAELRRRLDELSLVIDRMGPVNLDAKTEYEEAELRFGELNRHKLDLEKALEELERAIKHMNRESRRRFREAFDAVNGLFRKTFYRLFRGGRAELVLTDPEDLLDSGVDIVAQPPGKKLGNIELMSGGEKALTATALIFAIFEYRPSPFCVLDEVDAPLDEANVARYNDAIRSMTDRSQFIVVTHVRKTMQSVDVLYGVTMGDPGVSRLVSVKVNDSATARSDSRSTRASEDSTQVA
jgi:chromosome segregation protein